MPINITDGFNLNYSAPVDYRMTTANSTTRLAIVYKYDGMRTFQLDTRTNYIWNASSSSWDIEGSGSISGSGTLNYVPKFTSSNQLGISSIYVNSDKIGINTNNPQANLQIGSSPVAYGLSLPLTIDKGLIATIGYNWYSNGFTDLYFDSIVGSSQIKFHEGTIAFATRIGGGSLKNNMVILPEGPTYKGSVVFTDASQIPTILPSNTRSAMIRSQGAISYSTQTTPDYTWYDDNQTGIFRPSSSTIAFTNNGSESVRINSNGQTILPTGSTSSPALVFSPSGNAGIYSISANKIGISSASVNQITIDQYDFYANIHNKGTNGIGDSGNNASPWSYPSIASGRFTLVSGDVTVLVDCSFSSITPCLWHRTGNTVTVSGQIILNITAGTDNTFRLKIPIPSRFDNTWQLNGLGKIVNTGSGGVGGDIATIQAKGTGSAPATAQFEFFPSVTGTYTMVYQYTYEVSNWFGGYSPK